MKFWKIKDLFNQEEKNLWSTTTIVSLNGPKIKRVALSAVLSYSYDPTDSNSRSCVDLPVTATVNDLYILSRDSLFCFIFWILWQKDNWRVIDFHVADQLSNMAGWFITWRTPVQTCRAAMLLTIVREHCECDKQGDSCEFLGTFWRGTVRLTLRNKYLSFVELSLILIMASL